MLCKSDSKKTTKIILKLLADSAGIRTHVLVNYLAMGCKKAAKQFIFLGILLKT